MSQQEVNESRRKNNEAVQRFRKKKKKDGLVRYDVYIYPKHVNLLRQLEMESRESSDTINRRKGKINFPQFAMFDIMRNACPIPCECSITTTPEGDLELEWVYMVNGENYAVNETLEPNGEKYFNVVAECSEYMIDHIMELS